MPCLWLQNTNGYIKSGFFTAALLPTNNWITAWNSLGSKCRPKLIEGGRMSVLCHASREDVCVISCDQWEDGEQYGVWHYPHTVPSCCLPFTTLACTYHLHEAREAWSWLQSRCRHVFSSPLHFIHGYDFSQPNFNWLRAILTPQCTYAMLLQCWRIAITCMLPTLRLRLHWYLSKA